MILAIANANRGIGFSHLISSGNEAVLDAVDYMEFLLDDPRTQVITAFLEAIRRPRAFQRACERAAALNKPVVLVKVGRCELARRAAVTHTGALAGADEVQDAFFRRVGAVRVNSIDELLETAARRMPESAWVACRLAEVEFRSGQPDRAALVLRGALEREATLWESLLECVRALPSRTAASGAKSPTRSRSNSSPAT